MISHLERPAGHSKYSFTKGAANFLSIQNLFKMEAPELRKHQIFTTSPTARGTHQRFRVRLPPPPLPGVLQYFCAWDSGYGQPFDKTAPQRGICFLPAGLIAGLSLLGGQPFEPENQRGAAALRAQLQGPVPRTKRCGATPATPGSSSPAKSPSPARCEVTDELLALLDVLVDGNIGAGRRMVSPCASAAAATSACWM